MLMTYHDLLALVETGVIENVKPEQINAASIDITLGEIVLVEDIPSVCDLTRKESPRLRPLERETDGSWILHPGDFVLASTEQVFNLPDHVAAEYKLKSSLARSGLQHLLAGWCDPGWHGATLTLELINITRGTSLRIRQGMPIGQMVFWSGQPVPSEASYAARGRYNGQRAPQPSKGVE